MVNTYSQLRPETGENTNKTLDGIDNETPLKNKSMSTMQKYKQISGWTGQRNIIEK